MRRIRLIHWHEPEAAERAARLRAAGYEVAGEAFDPASLRELRREPPAAVVIDLSRLPMQGRDVALAVRHYKTTRHLPVIFVEGDTEKTASIRRQVPDAVYTTWSRVRASLRQALAHPPAVSVAPASLLAGYSGTPLPKKLGIKASSAVALIDAPPGFEKTLGELPAGATLRRQTGLRPDLTVWFVRSRRELERRIEAMAALADHGGLWIAWPKKTSSIAGDLSEAGVRRAGLGAGLVDFKVCAIDATWSGLRFSRRRGSTRS